MLSLVVSLPDFIVWEPLQYALATSRIYYHLSKVSSVLLPKEMNSNLTKHERRMAVDLELELAQYTAPHSNTKNHHRHPGICLVHPKYNRIVDINRGNIKMAVIYALVETLNEMGCNYENPYALGVDRHGQPVIAPVELFNQKGVLKPRKHWKKYWENKTREDDAGIHKFLATVFTKLQKQKLPSVQTSKAQAIRNMPSTAGIIQDAYPKGPIFKKGRNQSVRDENREDLDYRLKKNNAGLKVGEDGGLVFSANGLHEAASETDGRWTLSLVEERCGLVGVADWTLGLSPEAQKENYMAPEKAAYRQACKMLNSRRIDSVKCDMLDALPWDQTDIDVLAADNDLIHIGILERFKTADIPGVLDIVKLVHQDQFPIGTVLMQPVLPEGQYFLCLHWIPATEIDRLRCDLAPAIVVQTGPDTFSAMLLFEELAEGRGPTHLARTSLAGEFCADYKCQLGPIGVPLAGLPQFPEPFITKLMGKATTYSSPVMQQRLVATWAKLRAETQVWWQTLSTALAENEADLIGQLISKFDIEMSEVLPQAIAESKQLYAAPLPMTQLNYGPPQPQQLSLKRPAVVQSKAPNVAAKTPQQQIAPLPVLVKPPQVATQQKIKPAPAATPTPQVQDPKRPVDDEDKNELKKQRRTKQLMLLAGYNLYRSDQSMLDAMQEKFRLDRREIAVFARVWRNVLASKDADRIKTLKDYAGDKPVHEPEWLALEVEKAEQELIAEPEQNQSNNPELEQGFAR